MMYPEAATLPTQETDFRATFTIKTHISLRKEPVSEMINPNEKENPERI